MKGIGPLGIIAVLAGFLVLMAYSGMNLRTASLVQYGGKSCELARWMFGRYECVPMGYTSTIEANFAMSAGSTPAQSQYITCGDNENTDRCQFTVTCIDPTGNNQNWNFAYQDDTNANCKIGSTAWCGFTTGLAYFTTTKRLTSMRSDIGGDYQRGDRVRLGGCYVTLIYANFGYTTKVSNYHNVYKMYKIAGNGQKAGEWAQCALPSDSRIIKDCGNMEGVAKEQCSSEYQSAYVPFGKWVNYADFPVLVPAYMNIHTYGSSQVICESETDGKAVLWEIGEVKTTGDQCLLMPKTRLAEKECCNGQTGPAGQVCKDWKWVVGAVAQCQTSQQCSGGTWYYASSGTEMWRDECVNGKCVRGYYKKTIDCVQDIDCQRKLGAGYACSSGKCVVVLTPVEVVCGDGVCNAPRGETTQNCPADCRGLEFGEILTAFLAALLVGGVVSGLLFFVLHLPIRIAAILGIGLALLLTVAFTMPMASLAASWGFT